MYQSLGIPRIASADRVLAMQESVLREIDEAGFRKLLSELGVRPGSTEFGELLSAWRALQRRSY
jgi:hypothetical protein